MLADEDGEMGCSGRLDADLHLPCEWMSRLIGFIGSVLPGWRDDALRPPETGETKLTAQLCAWLNSRSRHMAGWDFLQFRREEPDETDGRRAIDLVGAPLGRLIWIEGRRYTEYQALLPIECKRIPTPEGPERDEREYVVSRFTSTGGIQRFKAGHHGAAHRRVAMIGYVQDGAIAHWRTKVGGWIDSLAAASTEGWSSSDALALADHDEEQGAATLTSNHNRQRGLDPIRIDHLWIEMSSPVRS